MSEENLIKLLSLMGINKWKSNGRIIQASCPFALWRHAKGTDKNPSFSIKIDNINKSVAYCHTCGSKGTLMQIAKELSMYVYTNDIISFLHKNENYHDYFISNKDEKKFGYKLNWQKARWLSKSINNLSVTAFNFDENNVKELSWSNIEPYLKSIPRFVLKRGITKETAKIFNLGYIKKQFSLLIPVIDRKQRLVGIIKRRLFESEHIPKYLYNTGFEKSNFLLGENLINENRGDLVITEGFFDVAKIYQAGYNALGVMGSSISDVQIQKIIELLPLGKKVILMFDNDLAGIKCMEQTYSLLKDKVNVVKRLPPEGKDAGDLTEKQIINLIQTNECK